MNESIIKVRGMYHVQIVEEDRVVGDSGWLENQISNVGFNDYLCKLISGLSGSKQITHVALGTGTVPDVSATSLNGEVSKRAAINAATSATSKTIRFTATFESSNSFVTASKNLQNIGLFEASSGGNLFAGNTYASSACATNQNVNLTYEITFG